MLIVSVNTLTVHALREKVECRLSYICNSQFCIFLNSTFQSLFFYTAEKCKFGRDVPQTNFLGRSSMYPATCLG